MDRHHLIKSAPQYYRCSICAFFAGLQNRIASSNTIWSQAKGMENNLLFWRTLRELVSDGILHEIPDDFGPTLYRTTEVFNFTWGEMKKKEGTPAFKYAIDPNGGEWIASAMKAVNKALSEQKIVEADFDKPDAEWEPLPLERDNPKFKKATSKLEETIAAAEADNGYNANVPEERAFVVESLKEASEKLKKSDTVSVAFVRRKIIDVLNIVIRRFGQASLGVTAQATRAAIFDWIKDAAGKTLHWLAASLQ
jgi:hypothetical protein